MPRGRFLAVKSSESWHYPQKGRMQSWRKSGELETGAWREVGCGAQRDLCHGEKTGKGDRHLDATSRDDGVGATIQLEHETQIEGSRVSICSRIPQHWQLLRTT